MSQPENERINDKDLFWKYNLTRFQLSELSELEMNGTCWEHERDCWATIKLQPVKNGEPVPFTELMIGFKGPSTNHKYRLEMLERLLYYISRSDLRNIDLSFDGQESTGFFMDIPNEQSDPTS